jgi:fluoroquinolone transport system permease protein
MRKIWTSFLKYLTGVWDDYMLVACMFAPILMGLAFFFGIPALEKVLCSEFAMIEILKPYYRMFDLLLSIMTPIMFVFSGVMTMLEENDNKTARYLMVTPLGRSGYLMSRIGLNTVFAFIYTIIAVMIFGLSKMSLLMNLMTSFLNALLSIVVAMVVIAFAKNKVEGMALIKLSGLLLLGIPVAYFIPSPTAYLCSILPSFWMTKLAMEGNYIYMLPTIGTLFLWGGCLYKRFLRRMIA